MRGWIPALPMALGITSFGFSWIVLFIAAGTNSAGPSFPALAWIHLVALGWITLIALSVLIHAIPTFLDVRWRLDGVARTATLLFAVGAFVLVGGFLSSNLIALQVGAWLALIGIVVYVIAAGEPLSKAIWLKGTSRAIARAFAATLAFLLVTASLGVLFASALGSLTTTTMLFELPKSHALLGIAGWLSLLVIGVSARTMGPIAGARSSRTWMHILSSTAVLVGAVAAAIGVARSLPPLTFAGCILLLCGAFIYIADITLVLLHATVEHRPPQLLMACAGLAAVASSLLALGAAIGRPWGAASIYVALLGWIGGAVLAHVHHIGVRVLLTEVRGEDDQTRPGAVLAAPLTWMTVAGYEAAVILGASGLLRAEFRLVQLAAIMGFVSFLVLLLNLTSAYRTARQ
jgi:hypothetical protein